MGHFTGVDIPIYAHELTQTALRPMRILRHILVTERFRLRFLALTYNQTAHPQHTLYAP